MKTASTRLIITMAIALILIGATLSGIGWFFGGATTIDYDNGWSVGINGINFSQNGRASRQEAVNEKLQAFANIDINTDVAEIDVVSGSDYGISIQKGSNPVDYSVLDGTLNVAGQVNKNVNILNFGFGDDYASKITITVPANAQLKEVKIVNNVGDIDVENLTCDYLNVKSDVGKSDITVFASKLKIKSDVGDVDVEGVINGDIDIATDVGEIDMNLKGNLDDYSVIAKNGVGKLNINGSSYGMDSDVAINNGAKYNITVHSGVGEATINIR